LSQYDLHFTLKMSGLAKKTSKSGFFEPNCAAEGASGGNGQGGCGGGLNQYFCCVVGAAIIFDRISPVRFHKPMIKAPVKEVSRAWHHARTVAEL
jgi:hypothetical protein